MSDTERKPLVPKDDRRKYGAIQKDEDEASSSSTSSQTSLPNGSTSMQKDAIEMRSTLTFLEKAGYGLGHVYNDLCAGVWFSYTLLFLHEALQLSEGLSGTLVMVGQVGDAIATPLIGALSDRYGTKRGWHIAGSILVTLSFPMIFSVCPWCTMPMTWWEPTYFVIFILAFQLGWPTVQISHLSMIPEIARTQRDRMDLTAIRYSSSVISSIVVYIVMWCVISAGDDIQTHIVPADKPKFRDVSLILTLIGVTMVVCFHISLSMTGRRRQRIRDELSRERNTTEKNEAENETILKNEHDAAVVVVPKKSYLSVLLFQNIFLYVFSRLFCTTALVYIPLWLNERSSTPDSLLTPETAGDKSVAHVAIIPLISFLSSFVSSVLMKSTNRWIKAKIAYLIGSVTSISACLCVIFWAPPSASMWVLVGIAILFGAGSSITMISSLCIAAEMIAEHVESSGFIYSAVTFFDKMITGVVVMLIETLKCKSRTDCPEYYRNVLAYACGVAVVLGFLTLASLQINRRRPVASS